MKTEIFSGNNYNELCDEMEAFTETVKTKYIHQFFDVSDGYTAITVYYEEEK